jgi:hypothetical protein
MYGTGPGAVVYGPGARLKAGTYIVTFRFKSKRYSSSSSGSSSSYSSSYYGPINYDVAVGLTKVATGSVTPGSSGDWMFKALKVKFDEDKSKVQYRVWPNKRYCTVDRIWVFRMAD